MSTEIRRDIKSKQNNSAFRQVGNAVFSINPSYTQEKLERDEKEEITREKDVESERTTSQYIGRAGEHLVVSELLFRGYNASIMTVDEGIDITAIKGDKLFNIQAKTSKENKFNKHVITISVSSFQTHQSHNIYYIFVLRGNTTNFLILPYIVIRKNIDESNILETSNKRYKVQISVDKEGFFLGTKK